MQPPNLFLFFLFLLAFTSAGINFLKFLELHSTFLTNFPFLTDLFIFIIVVYLFIYFYQYYLFIYLFLLLLFCYLFIYLYSLFFYYSLIHLIIYLFLLFIYLFILPSLFLLPSFSNFSQNTVCFNKQLILITSSTVKTSDDSKKLGLAVAFSQLSCCQHLP